MRRPGYLDSSVCLFPVVSMSKASIRRGLQAAAASSSLFFFAVVAVGRLAVGRVAAARGGAQSAFGGAQSARGGFIVAAVARSP
jgi:hypothetical protein